VAACASRASALVRHRQSTLPARHRYTGRPGTIHREHRPRFELSGIAGARGRCMSQPAARTASPRLTAARACAWALLVSGWVGVGSFAMVVAPGVASGFALVALWLLVLGGAATVATRGGLPPWLRALALLSTAALTVVGLWWTVHGGGVPALIVVLLGWAALTALASGVVRSLRWAQRVAPAPPIAAAGLGALCAGLVLGDI